MLINIWPGGCNNQLERMNTKVGKYNGKDVGMVNGPARKFVGFQATNIGRSLVVSFQLLHLVLGGRGYCRNPNN